MTLARRTILSFAWVLGLAIVGCGYVLYGLDRITAGQAQERRSGEAVDHAHFMDTALHRGSLLLAQYVEEPDPARVRELHALRFEAAAHRKALRQVTSLPRVVELLDAYESIQPERELLADRIIEDTKGSGTPMLRQQRDVLDVRAREHLREIVRIETEILDAAIAKTGALTSELRTNTVILFVVLIGSAILISLSVVRDIARRVVPLLAMSRELSVGNFAARVRVEGNDEVAALSAALNEMAGQLHELDQVKDEFVALASHQLRTPATAVKANIAMLLDGYFGELSAEQREFLQDAYDANERQLEVIEDILNVARAETGRLVLETAPVDLVQLVDDSVAEHRFGISDRRQHLDVALPAGPLMLSLDGKKMRMVVDNLVSNATKYTPEGGSIRVTLEEAGDRVAVEVADSGVGIAAGDRERLFRKFSRVDNPLSVSAGGTGLGLYLAGEIVRLHEGEIIVVSEPGKGSTFRVLLPRK
jgi:signal transduction histidine kinase